MECFVKLLLLDYLLRAWLDLSVYDNLNLNFYMTNGLSRLKSIYSIGISFLRLILVNSVDYGLLEL